MEIVTKDYFEQEIEPVDVFIGQDISWSLPDLKIGVLDNIESIDVDFGTTQSFIDYNELTLEFSIESVNLREEHIGSHKVKIVVSNSSGA